MKKVLTFIAIALTVSAAIFSLPPESMAAFVPNPGPSQPGPAQPPQQPPQPAPQYQPQSLEGMWHFVSDNTVAYLIITGNQHQFWVDGQLKESGTFTVQGNTMYIQPNGFQPRSENFQLSPDGMVLTLFETQGSSTSTFRKVQNTPSQPSPQPMPSPMPQSQPPTYPQPPQPGYPQPAPPTLDGRWQKAWNGSPVYLVFLGNRYQVLDNMATAEQGTFVVQGGMIGFTPDGRQPYSNYLTVSPDGSAITTGGNDGSVEWRKIS